jgi:hypothetical protein
MRKATKRIVYACLCWLVAEGLLLFSVNCTIYVWEHPYLVLKQLIEVFPVQTWLLYFSLLALGVSFAYSANKEERAEFIANMINNEEKGR